MASSASLKKSSSADSCRLTIVTRPGNDPVIIPRIGLQLPQRLVFDRWLTIGHQLSRISVSLAWCLGDWLIYGEATFTGRYRDAVEQTSLDYQTLRNYAWVARSFPLARRRDWLSFGHHAEVAALPEPEQDFWLRKAEDLSWSRNRLRREVRLSQRERGQTCPPSRPAGPQEDSEPASIALASAAEGSVGNAVKFEIHVSAQELELFESQADRIGLSLQAWALMVLSQAAGNLQ